MKCIRKLPHLLVLASVSLVLTLRLLTREEMTVENPMPAFESTIKLSSSETLKQPGLEDSLQRAAKLTAKPVREAELTQAATTTEPTTKPTPKPDLEAVIRARMDQIRTVCSKKKQPNFNYFKMYYFPEFGLTWLPVFKASSTTWKRFFIDQILPPDANINGNHYHFKLILGNELSKKQMLPHKAGSKRKRMWKVEPNDSIRFTVIRHPLSRLVSHYRKTMVSASDRDEFRDQWIKATIIHARKKKSWSNNQRKKFEQELENMLRLDVETPKNPGNPYLALPTFPELVRFILDSQKTHDSRGSNDHWVPNAKRTDICQNDLDIVIKLENERDELPYLLEKLNITQFTDKLMSKANPSGDENVASTEVEEHLKLLTKNEQIQLNKMYQIDYDIFGYEPVNV